MSALIYYAICTAGFAGIILLKAESYSRELIMAKRWRLKLYNANYKEMTIVKLFYEIAERKKIERFEIEIYEAVSYMRNIIAIGKEKSLNSDSLIEQLILHNGKLTPIYAKTLRMLRQNQREEAVRYFSESVAMRSGSDFARLLIHWDLLAPKRLLETLLSYQKNIRESRITLLKKRDEIVSDLIYLPVIVNVMLIFVNFIYIGYFIDQREILTMLL